jgi:hypothetical protein
MLSGRMLLQRREPSTSRIGGARWAAVVLAYQRSADFQPFMSAIYLSTVLAGTDG